MLNSVVIIGCIMLSLASASFYDFARVFWVNYMEERERLKTHDWVQDQCSNPVHKKHLKRLAVECDHITWDTNIWNVAWEASKHKLPWLYQWVHYVFVMLVIGLVLACFVYRRKMKRFFCLMLC